MKLQTGTLFDWMLAYEREHLGQHSVTLQGSPFLSTDLHFLQVYLSSGYKHRPAKDVQCAHMDELDMQDWLHFPLYLFENSAPAQTGKIVARTLSFLKWLSGRVESPVPLTLTLQALKSGEKELRRLQQMHKHLAHMINSRIYQPGPTDLTEDIAWLDEMHQLSKPVAVHINNDIYRVLSKNRKQGYACLSGESTGMAIAFRADALLIRLLHHGDRLPLILGENAEGQYFLKDYDRPLVNMNFQTDE